MNEAKINSLNKKAGNSMLLGILGIIGSVIAFAMGASYSSEAEAERMRDPQYQEALRKREAEQRALREKELEAEKQRYILEQEKLKAAEENRKLSAVQDLNAKAREAIEAVDADDLDDYGIIDAAYRIMDILSQEGITEQVRYRGLAKISSFKDYTEKTATDEKLDEILAKIERL